MSILIAGKKSKNSYRGIALEKIIGKKIEAITEKTVDGDNGAEICYEVLFTDGTKHGFVVPSED